MKAVFRILSVLVLTAAINACSKKDEVPILPPKECAVAIKLNPWDLARKSSLMELNTSGNNKLIDKITQKLPKSIDLKDFNILTSGINFFESTFIFLSCDSGQNTIWTVLGLLASEQQFQNSVSKLFTPHPIQKREHLNKSYHYLILDSVAIAFNHQLYIITTGLADSSSAISHIDRLWGLTPAQPRHLGFDFLYFDKSDISVWINTQYLPEKYRTEWQQKSFIPLIPENHSVNLSINFEKGGYTLTAYGKTKGMEENFLKYLKQQLQ